MNRINRRTAITRLVQFAGATGVIISTPFLAGLKLAASQEVASPRTDLPYSALLQNLVDMVFPGWRLPARCDLLYDWAEYFDLDSLWPMLTQGDFFGNKKDSFALIILKGSQYKFVLAREITSGFQVFELEEGSGVPQRMYVHAVGPGRHRVGESIRQYGVSPKEVSIQHSGIEVGLFESASCLYFWNESSGVQHQRMTD